MADCEEFPCVMGLDRKCPLCGGKRTRFGDSWSDGDEWIERGFNSQQCTKCGTPCKMWDSIEKKFKDLRDALALSTEVLEDVVDSKQFFRDDWLATRIAGNKVVLGNGGLNFKAQL